MRQYTTQQPAKREGFNDDNMHQLDSTGWLVGVSLVYLAIILVIRKYKTVPGE
jgi:hypothetical protein